MSERKWTKGANGLWHTHDPVIQKQVARQAEKSSLASAMAAIAVFFGDEAKMRRWMRQKKQFLGGISPAKAIKSPDTRAILVEQIARMEHGIFC